MHDRLQRLRDAFAAQGVDGFILPVNDEFMGEYIPDSARRLAWLTGFTGSAGLVAVLRDKAAFFTDGRYTLQAEAETGQGFARFNSGETSPEQWLKEHAQAGAAIGYDPWLHTRSALLRYQGGTPGLTWKPLAPNPIDALWADRPPAPMSHPHIHALHYAGETSAAKRARIAAMLVERKADAAVLSAPDSICWLLNIRADDVPYTPFALCYAIIAASGRVTLYIDAARLSPEVCAHLGSDVVVAPPGRLPDDLAECGGMQVLYDPASMPIWFYLQLTGSGAIIIDATDPCLLPKACKNAVEQEGMRQAHIRDGLAVTRFLHWLSQADYAWLSELDIAAKLEAFRAESPLYLGPSFNTISGSGPNGAIVHYRADAKSSRRLDRNSLLLLDSGGQYADGTTDITRTIALGTPGVEMKDRFTRVLRGHIALARAHFPEGTTGSQLDALARQYLWQAALDYDHGTGHGVGSYLSVHEGPQRIGKRGGDAPLMPGMVVSNEPGYYKTGAYGIRIESLVLVQEDEKSEGKRYFHFETLTLAPIDLAAIDMAQLTREDKTWLNAYHQQVYATHAPMLSETEAQWLAAVTEAVE